jgi:hypothetical protein
MSQSSPEGIILGKGSRLVSLDLSINDEKVLSIKNDRLYTNEEVLEHLNHLIMMPSSKLDTFTGDDGMVTKKWFEQF